MCVHFSLGFGSWIKEESSSNNSAQLIVNFINQAIIHNIFISYPLSYKWGEG